MRHSLQSEDFGVRLRPVRLEDAAFIVWLRNLDHVKGRVGDSAATLASQKAWLEKYFERAGDYYFIAETQGGIPFGTHGIYNVNGTRGETGRYIMRPEVLAGVAASVLALDLSFGALGLTELSSTSVSTNRKVHSLHRKSGFKQVGLKPAAQVIDGQPVDLVEFLLTAKDWHAVRDEQLPLARLAGAQLLEWERTQSLERQPWLCPQSPAPTGLMAAFPIGFWYALGEEWLDRAADEMESLTSFGSGWLAQDAQRWLETLNACGLAN